MTLEEARKRIWLARRAQEVYKDREVVSMVAYEALLKAAELLASALAPTEKGGCEDDKV